MKKIRIIAKAIASLVAATIGIHSSVVAFADTEVKENNIGENVQFESKETSDSEKSEEVKAPEIKVTTPDAVVVKPGNDAGEGEVIKEPVAEEPAIEQPNETINFDSEVSKADKFIKEFKVDNSTKEEDIISAVKKEIDNSISVSFGKNEGQKFNKKDATLESTGSITGTLILTNEGNSKEIQVNLNIEQLKKIEDNSIANIEVKINGLDKDSRLIAGNEASVDVTGYNALNEKVSLDSSKLSYKWYVKIQEIKTKDDGTKDVISERNELIGENKNLEINDELASTENLIKSVYCEVNYSD